MYSCMIYHKTIHLGVFQSRLWKMLKGVMSQYFITINKEIDEFEEIAGTC